MDIDTDINATQPNRLFIVNPPTGDRENSYQSHHGQPPKGWSIFICATHVPSRSLIRMIDVFLLCKSDTSSPRNSCRE
ncbi:hypothetical protein WN55_06381 [Dufourea novaeangliae]|uniref:Uncharacterized protein n=1 Tax=Dufourea novaeangliae TaxID=178035 RepID=A0A154PQI0_DUFNO|nr:hypothetical protein WN55_06381 [Dufourea novaeangliae]